MAATSSAAPGPGIATAEDLPAQRLPLPVPKAYEVLRHELAGVAAHSPTVRRLAKLALLRFGVESQAMAAILTGMEMG